MTLPFIFATCESKILDEISAELERIPAALFIEHAHDVLAFVLRLTGPGETKKALSFIVKVVAPENTVVDIKSIIVSCLAPLLTELVVVLGDEKEEHVISVGSASFWDHIS